MNIRIMSRFPDLVDKLRTAHPPLWSGGTKHPKLVPVWENVCTVTIPHRHVYHKDGYACTSTECPDFQISWTNYEQPPLPGGPVAQSIQNLSRFGKMYACLSTYYACLSGRATMHTFFQTGTSFGCFVPPDRRGGGAVRNLSTDYENLDILRTCMHTHPCDRHVYLAV